MTVNSLYEEVIIAGFGGQGVILSGRLLAQAAMNSRCEVTFMPSYGAEVRGGTANCMVIIANEPIASPLVTNPDSLIALNIASFNKFSERIKEGGLLILNSSMVSKRPSRNDIQILPVPVDQIALELDSPKSANMVAIGAYLQRRGLIKPETATHCLADVLAERYHNLLPVNKQAILRGAEFAKKLSLTC